MPYEDMNPKPRKKAENNFGKNIFKLVNKSVFRKNMKNFGKHRDIKLVTIDKEEIKWSQRQIITKHFSEILLGIAINKRNVNIFITVNSRHQQNSYVRTGISMTMQN